MFLAAGSATATVASPNAGVDVSTDEDASVSFTGTPNEPDSDSFTEGWIFEGNIVDGNAASWTFSTPGTFTVTYWVDDSGDISLDPPANVSDTLSVTVFDITPPSANAGGNQNVNEDTVVNLDAGNSTDNDPNFATTGRYYWTFSDNGVSRSLTGKTTTYTFTTPGTYSVNLLVLDAAGNFASSIMIVTAKDITAPSGSGTIPASSNEDASVAFSSASITDNDPSFSTTRRDYWVFTDGATPSNLSGSSQSYTFNTPGTFSITLTVMDTTGNKLTSLFSITIVDITAPTGGGTVPSTANEDASVSFSSSSITDNDPNFAANRRDYWTFTDGAPRNLSGTSQSYTFATPGIYTVTLTVMDITGNKLTSPFTLTITDITPPSGGATVPSSANEDTLVSFSSAAVSDNDPAFGGNRRDYWTFTDGVAQNLSGTGPSYTFATPGTFTITLLTMDITGNRLVQTFSITIADRTAPVVTIDSGSLAQTLERFRSFAHSGSAADNVAVSAYWWIFTDGSAQNISGSSMTRTWSNTGSFTLTLFARDAAFNIGSASTTFTVTADITAPTITFLLAPTSGDDQTPLTFSASISDLDPTCGASCTWSWLKNGTAFSTAVGSITTTFSPGQNTLTLTVGDPTGNLRSSAITLSIDQLVQNDLLWDTQNVTMNWNLRIVNGATFLIRNSTVWNASVVPAVTVVITVVNGRLILENSQMTSLSTTIGFKIVATGVNGSGSYLYFNGSTVNGLFDPLNTAGITVTNATLSASGSTFSSYRTATASAATPMILGTNANIYLTNVVFNITQQTGNSGIRATYTNLMTLLQRREIVIEGWNARGIPRTPFAFVATGVTGTVDTTIRDSQLRSTSPIATTRAIDISISSSTGVLSFRVQRVDAENNSFGGLFAVHSAFTGTVAYTIIDTNFNNAVSANGMYFQFLASSSLYSITMSNVTANRASQRGLVLRFEQAGWNTGSINLDLVDASNNTQDGLYFYQYGTSLNPARLTATTTITNSTFLFNKQNGMYFDTYYASRTNHTIALRNVQIANSVSRGIYFNEYYSSYNLTFDFADTVVDRNGQQGFYFYHYNTNSANGRDRGDHAWNFTRSSFSGNTVGLYLYSYGPNENGTSWWTDVNINNNTQQGVYLYTQLQYSYFYYDSVYHSGERNITIYANRVNIVNNGNDGIYAYDYDYGYMFYTCNPACGYQFISPSTQYDLYFNNSHIERNRAHGVYWYNGYAYAGASLFHMWLTGGSTLSDNAASGVYMYLYFAYSGSWQGWSSVGRGASDLNFNANNSFIQRNGNTGGDSYGVYGNAYQVYGGGVLFINISNTQLTDNRGTAVYFTGQYIYQAQSTRVFIENCNISRNGGRGFESSYFYMYQNQIRETVNNTTFIANNGEAIMDGFGQGYGRQFSGWTLTYTNNVFDQTPGTAIGSQVTYSCQGCQPVGGPDSFNFSNNRFTNIGGAAMAFGFDPPSDGQTIPVTIRDNYVADAEEGISISIPGSSNSQHAWVVVNNTVERVNGNAMLLAMTNVGAGNSGTLVFEANVFKNTGGTAFTLIQSNIKMETLVIKDCVFNTQRTGIVVSGILGKVDNATFLNTVKEDIILTDGILEIHNTPVDPTKLKPVGNAAAFNVYFHLKAYVVWSGTGKPVVGAVAQYSDATGNIFFVGTVADATGLPEMELWSYTKSTQGVLGRTPFSIDTTYFEIEQDTSVDLYQNRIVTIALRDNVFPTLVVSTPEDNYGTRSDTIKVEGTLYDSQSGFVFDINDPQLPSQYIEVSSDNVTWSTVHVKSSSAYEVQFDYTFTGLLETTTGLYLRVHDDALNYWTRVIPVRVDRTAPIVTIIEPASSSIVTNQATVRLSAETEIGALVFVNGLTPPEVFTRPDNIHVYFTMEIPVFEGPNTITVVAIDALNNQGNASLFALVDRQPPYLAVIEPDVDALVNSTTLVVNGQTERTGVSVTVNGALATLDPQGNFTSTVTLTSDINRVEILATDAAGNTQLVVREVKFDNTPPWINVQAPASNALLNSPEVDVIGIVEPGSRLIVNDEVVSAPTGAFSRRILLTEGANSIQFVAIDLAGNYGYRTVFVTVDTVKPTIDITAPTNESLVKTQNVVVTGTVSDDHSPSLLVNGQDIAVNTDGSFSVPISLYEGTNFISLEARDGAGNSNTKVVTVIADTTAPYLLPELDGTFLEGVQIKTYNASVTVKGFAEKTAVVEVCYRPVGGGNFTQVCNAIPLAADGSFRTFVELRKGETNAITVSATDAAGNSVSRTLAVTQSKSPEIPPEPTNWGLYGLYGLGVAILGGAFFLLYMRRGKGGQAVELAGAQPYYAPQGPQDLPMPENLPPSGEYAAPLSDVSTLSAPEVAGDVAVSTAPDLSFDEPAAEVPSEEPMLAPGEEVPAAPSRARPMRRRPSAGGEGGAEGGALTGMGAEEEAKPGDTHQDEGDESKEG